MKLKPRFRQFGIYFSREKNLFHLHRPTTPRRRLVCELAVAIRPRLGFGRHCARPHGSDIDRMKHAMGKFPDAPAKRIKSIKIMHRNHSLESIRQQLTAFSSGRK